jgi:hypothetical protein
MSGVGARARANAAARRKSTLRVARAIPRAQELSRDDPHREDQDDP